MLLKLTTRGLAALAVVATIVWVTYGVIAMADGIGSGIEVPSGVARMTGVAVICSIVLAATAWIVDRTARESAKRDIKPIIEEEVKRIVAAEMDILAKTLVEQFDAAVQRVFRAGMLNQAKVEAGLTNGSGKAEGARVMNLREYSPGD